LGILLNQIKKENDIKNIAPEDYRKLAWELRKRLVGSVSRTGGHLASNLGAVELTMALHLFLDFPKDKLIWDVGHQAYVHKLLTGRNREFRTLRRLDGISGFPKVSENPADTFNTGHSSTSISVALGMAKARDIRGGDEKVVAVIGDGALSGGMAFEALNNAEQMKSNLIIVLNDNKMSIAKNVGGMSKYLGRMRTNQKYNNLKINIEGRLNEIPNVGTTMAETIKNAKNSLKHLFVPGMFFEEMGIIYVGPIDGHNIEGMLEAFRAAARIKNRPVLIHVVTKKGRGYLPAETNPSMFHGVGAFDPKTGELAELPKRTYTDVFGEWLLEKGRECAELVSVCAAMPDGTGVKAFAGEFPNRSFDVGIAEEHAVTFSAGLVSGGLRPVVSIYSTFLQRAYDQILHDICLNRLPVIFAVDRSGIVGRDGDTHQGIFDISYLTSIPNMTVLSPADGTELRKSLDFAYDWDGPVAVRYPRGAVPEAETPEEVADFVYGRADIIMENGAFCENGSFCENRTCGSASEHEGKQAGEHAGGDFVIFAVGNMVRTAIETALLLRDDGISCTVVNMRFVKPFDEVLIRELVPRHKGMVTMEDNVASGGFGQQAEAMLAEHGIYPERMLNISIHDTFVEHGAPSELYARYGMDAEHVAERMRRLVNDSEVGEKTGKKAEKERLDVLLVNRGLSESREKAKALIMTGNVFVEGQREDKAGHKFPVDAHIEIKGKQMKFVSRGGYKLDKAMQVFPIELNGLICMDVGASTGGFTDCMLQNGARFVYAIDVGTNQLVWKLRQDSRVKSMEKTNIRYVVPEDIGEPVDFVSIDVAFISLSKVLAPVRELMRDGAQVVCLIKPQFEAGREKVGKKGVVRDPAVHKEVIGAVMQYAKSLGFVIHGLDVSPIRGAEGNIEYLLYAKKEGAQPEELTEEEKAQIERIVDQGVR
jgi:1-deoxy-D-xylulose-5-phosphate synthase